jgi:hypothetical protein
LILIYIFFWHNVKLNVKAEVLVVSLRVELLLEAPLVQELLVRHPQLGED